MATPDTVFAPDAIARAQQQLESFAQGIDGVHLVVLTSGDGFEIAAHPVGSTSTPRIAAMTSSMQALGTAMSHEAGVGGTRSLIIEADSGTLMVLDLGASLPRTSLAVVANKKEILGKLLWASRNLCKALENTLASSS